MASHLSSIGFPALTAEHIEAIIDQAWQGGTRVQAARGTLLYWAPGGGAEVWVQLNRRGEVNGVGPHFAGAGRVAVRVQAVLENPDLPMDGTVHAWAGIDRVRPGPDGEPEGCYPFLVDVPDFDRHRERLVEGTELTLQVAAFAHDLTLHPDDKAFAAAQDPRFPMAPESFLPVGLFAAEDNPGQAPTATAIFAGHVERAERLANPATGRPYWHLVVRTYGGKYDVVADPAILRGEPVVGGVAEGHFWLSGRVVESAGRS